MIWDGEWKVTPGSKYYLGRSANQHWPPEGTFQWLSTVRLVTRVKWHGVWWLKSHSRRECSLTRLSPLTRLKASFPPGGTLLKSPTVWLVKFYRIALHRLWCFKSYSGWQIWHSAFTTNMTAKYLPSGGTFSDRVTVHALQFPQSNFSITLRKTSLIFVSHIIISHANKTFSIFSVYKFST